MDSFGPEWDRGPDFWDFLAASFMTAAVLGSVAYGIYCLGTI